MSAPTTRRLALASLAAAALLVACSSSVTDPVGATAVTNFTLVDANPNSLRHGASVSVRDYTGGASAWYFLHST